MRIGLRTVVPALLAALLLLPAGATRELDGEAVVRGLQAWLDGTRDLECRFEQTLVSGALGSDLPESGTMILLRPGRIRWDYVKPEPKTALLAGDSTLVYLPGDRQLIRGRLSKEGGALYALLAGAGCVDGLFTSSLVAAPGRAGGRCRLRLVPRRQGENFEAVTVDLEPQSFGIEGAEVLDTAGNLIRYRFSGMRRNRGVSEARFHFEPPPGVEIIDAQ